MGCLFSPYLIPALRPSYFPCIDGPVDLPEDRPSSSGSAGGWNHDRKYDQSGSQARTGRLRLAFEQQRRKNMRRLMLIAYSLLLLPLGVMAQEVPPPRATANAFFGVGGAFSDGERAGVLHFGGGGEARIYKGLSAGAELGYLHPTGEFRDGFGLFSANGAYRFWTSSSSQRVVPFVTAGYSLAFRDGTANLANFGGGVDYWFHDRAALRLEVRDHIWPGQDGASSANFLMFRIGIVGR
jgi:hypothetical protein